MVAVNERIVHEHLGPVVIEGKRHFLNAFGMKRGADCLLSIRLAVEKQKSASTSAGNLPSHGAAVAGHPVEMVNPGIGNLPGNALLCPPSLVQQRSEKTEIARLKRTEHAVGQGSHLVEGVKGGPGVAMCCLFLFLQYCPGMRKSIKLDCSSHRSSGSRSRGCTSVRPSLWKVMKFKPPKAAANSSCLPTWCPRTSRAMRNAHSARSYFENGRFRYVVRVLRIFTHTLAEEPKPVPGGISEDRKRSTEISHARSLSTARGISRPLPRVFMLAISRHVSKTRRSEEIT